MSNESKSEHDDKNLVTIIVNGTEHGVAKGDITFAQLFRAHEWPADRPEHPLHDHLSQSGGEKPEGTLVEGGTAKVKEGTIFNVTATDKS